MKLTCLTSKGLISGVIELLRHFNNHLTKSLVNPGTKGPRYKGLNPEGHRYTLLSDCVVFRHPNKTKNFL